MVYWKRERKHAQTAPGICCKEKMGMRRDAGLDKMIVEKEMLADEGADVMGLFEH
jgi:hypothetical protein